MQNVFAGILAEVGSTGDTGAPASDGTRPTAMVTKRGPFDDILNEVGLAPAAPAAPTKGRLSSAASSLGQEFTTSVGRAIEGVGVGEMERRELSTKAFDMLDAGDFAGVTNMVRTYAGLSGPVGGYVNATPEQRKELREIYAPVDDLVDTAGGKAGAAVKALAQDAFKPAEAYRGEFWSDVVPHAFGSAGAVLATGAAGTVLGGPLAGTGAMAGAGASMAASALFEDAVQNGASIDDALLSAKLGGSVGMTEAFPMASLLRRADRITGGRVRNALVKAAQEGTEEAVQEAFQSVSENLIASEIVAYDPERQTFEGLGEAAGAGATVGGVLGFVQGFVTGGRRARSGEAPKDDAVLQAEDETDEQRELVALLQQNGSVPTLSLPQPDAANAPRIEAPQRPSGARTTHGDGFVVRGEDGEVLPLPSPREFTPEGFQPGEGFVYEDPKSRPAGRNSEVARGLPFRPDKVVEIAEQEQVVEQDPTDGQKEAGNYRKGHVRLGGLDISIESPRGGIRKGRGPDGREWSVEMPAAYGYIKRTEGADGDQVDVYLGPEPDSEQVFVVDQVDPETGRFDEHKAMIGFRSAEQAAETYLRGFSDGRGEQRAGAITTMTLPEFKVWLTTGETRKPVRYEEPEFDAERFMPAAISAVNNRDDKIALTVNAFSRQFGVDRSQAQAILDGLAARGILKKDRARNRFRRLRTPTSIEERVANAGGIDLDEFGASENQGFRRGYGHIARKGGRKLADLRAILEGEGWVDTATSDADLLATLRAGARVAVESDPERVSAEVARKVAEAESYEKAKAIVDETEREQREAIAAAVEAAEREETDGRPAEDTEGTEPDPGAPDGPADVAVDTGEVQGRGGADPDTAGGADRAEPEVGSAEDVDTDRQSEARQEIERPGLDVGRMTADEIAAVVLNAETVEAAYDIIRQIEKAHRIARAEVEARARAADPDGNPVAHLPEEIATLDDLDRMEAGQRPEGAARPNRVIDGREVSFPDFLHLELFEIGQAIVDGKKPSRKLAAHVFNQLKPFADMSDVEDVSDRSDAKNGLVWAEDYYDEIMEPLSTGTPTMSPDGRQIWAHDLIVNSMEKEYAAIGGAWNTWAPGTRDKRYDEEDPDSGRRIRRAAPRDAKKAPKQKQPVEQRQEGGRLRNRRIRKADRGKESADETSRRPAVDRSSEPAPEAGSSVHGDADQIEDFGEVLHGARKHMAAYQASLVAAMDQDVESVALSKSWPEPNYAKLIEDGADPWTVAFVHAARDEVPAKPRLAWKVSRWAEQVRVLRKMSMDLISGDLPAERLREKLEQPEFKTVAREVGGRADLYFAVGHERSLKGVRLTKASYSFYKGQEYRPAKEMWSVERPSRKSNALSNWPRQIVVADTREEAIDLFKAKLAIEAPEGPKPRQVRFDIYRRPGNKQYIVGKKIGREHADLKSFDDLKDARRYVAENHDDLVEALEAYKRIPAHRRLENSPRVGEDHRNGEDVTPEMFEEAFGFRGVQFGNYVEGPKRQQDLNQAYDALMDLAGILGLPSRALSLNGEMGLAFGARGKGGKNAATAHFEPDTVVINLTKRGGAGSLAHEWWHSVDNHFSRRRGKAADYITRDGHGQSDAIRSELRDAFDGIISAIRETAMPQRSSALDQRRSKPYWQTAHEMSARAFESYVIAKLADASLNNDYLANVVPEDAFGLVPGRNGELVDGYPYPKVDELPAVREGFDTFFRTVLTRETDRGVEMHSRDRGEGAGDRARRKGRTRRSTPAEDADEVRVRLQARLQQLGIADRIALRVADRLTMTIEGRKTGIHGRYLRGLIEVSMESGSREWVLNHEAIHALKDLGLFTDGEWGRLTRHAKLDPDRMASIRRDYDDLPLDQQLEEAVADMFADYAAGRLKLTDRQAMSLLERIQHFFRALGEAIRGAGFRSVEDIFSEIEAGRFADRDGSAGFPIARAARRSEPSTAAENQALGEKAMEEVLANETDVPAAMHRKEIGWIGFRWGDRRGGIRHLIERREQEGRDGEAVAREVPSIIARGRMGPFYLERTGNHVRRNIVWAGKTVVLQPEIRGDEMAWVLTAFVDMSRTPKQGRPISQEEAWKRVSDASGVDSKRHGRATQTDLRALAGKPDHNRSSLGAETKKNVGGDNDEGKASRVRTEPPPPNPDERVRHYRRHAAEEILGAGFVPPSQTAQDFFADTSKPMWARFAGAADAHMGLRRKLQDKFIDVKRAQDAIVEARGLSRLSERTDTYLAEELYYGRAGKRLTDFAHDHVDPLLEAIERHGLALEEIELFLYARHAPERNAQIQKINPEFEDGGGSGMTDEEAAGVLADFDGAGKTAALEEVAALVDEINRGTLRAQLDGGLIDRETYDTLRATYRHYVPLRGQDFAQDAELPRIGKGFDIRGKESKRAMGRRSQAHDILAYVLAQREEAIVRAEKNEVAKTFLRMVEENPNPDMWEVVEAPISRRINPRTGMVEEYASRTHELRDNVLSVKVDGKEHFVEIRHDGIARAMKNLGVESAGGLTRALMRFNRLLAAVNTSWNPEFVISNMARDLQTAAINLSAEETKGIAGRVLRDVPKAMKGAYQGIKGGRDGEWAQHFHEYADAGGKIEFFGLKGIDERQKELIARLEEIDGSNMAKVKSGFRKLKDFIEETNGAVENAVRLSAFVHAREAGLSPARAASLARNLTVNFNRKGEWAPVMNGLYLFYNAGLQGSIRMVQALGSARVRKVVAGIVVTSLMLDLINRAVSEEDDDGIKHYDRIPEWVKERNLIVMLPGQENWIQIPLPYGYNVFHLIGQNVGAVAAGAKAPMTGAADVLTAAVQAFNPVGGTNSLLSLLSPTITDPIVEISTNRNFANNPIKPENAPWGVPKPESQLYFSTVSPISKAITDQLNEMTGGNEIRPGAIDVSPEVLDHVYSFLSGGLGRFIKRTADLPFRAVSDEEIAIKDVPFARRVVGSPMPWRFSKEYYGRLAAVQLAQKELKHYAEAGAHERVREIRRDRALDLKLAPVFKNAEKQLRKLRKRRRMLNARLAAGEAVKEGDIEAVNDQINKIMVDTNRAYLEARKQR